MKKLFLLAFMLCGIMQAWAETWTDSNGVTWTYTLFNSEATITKSSKTTGDLVIPSKVNGYSVTSIGVEAFEDCTGLTSVFIPKGVTRIDSYAFSGCSCLTHVTIPETVTNFGFSPFSECSRLSFVNLLVIDKAIFYNNSIVRLLNNGIVNRPIHLIDESGSEITEYIIPEGVQNVNNAAFYNCIGLTSVTIPESVTNIGNNAFTGCTGLASVTIPSSLSSIGVAAFSGCTSLTSVSIPSSVSSFGSNAFSGCTSLTSVTIHEGVMSIGGNAFSGCTSLSFLKVPVIDKATFCNNSVVGLLHSTGLPIHLIDNDGNEITEFEIPEGVTTIGHRSFWGCTGLSSVTIPSSVTSIEYNAFSDCTGLTAMIIPSSVRTIGNGVFSGCKNLSSITISEGIMNLGSAAFKDCTSLTSVTIPSSVTSIDATFWGCTGLSFVAIPSSVTSIGNRAFQGCSSLVSVFIPESVVVIDELAFYECIGLSTINIPESVTNIGSSAFYGCSSLTSVSIPSSVTSIGNYAFYNCNSLTSVTCNIKTPLTITANTFSNSADATLYIPAGSKDAYENAQYWQDFNDIVELEIVEPAPTEVTFSIGSLGVSTFASAYDLDFSGITGMKAYIASGFSPSEGTLVLTRANKVPAGTGLYVKGTPGTYTIPVEETDMVYSNFLVGLTEDTQVPPTTPTHKNYILANGSHGVGFYTLSQTGSIAAGKAYLSIPTSSGSASANFIGLEFEDEETTDISLTTSPSPEGERSEYFTLDGRKLNGMPTQKGVYIVNGKKIVIR